jgi:1-acyl-sn-glycerol-3-phosphate acyltransferase
MAKRKAEGERRPNRLLYALGKALLWPLFRFRYRYRVIRSGLENLKPPFVVVANHASGFDFALVILAMKGVRLQVVTSAAFFYAPWLRRVLTLAASIPRLQMVPDPVSVRRMMEVVRSGGVICLFPQGQVSYDGRDAKMLAGTGKLLQRLRVPIVSVKLSGAHLTKPKWAKKTRRGRIEAHASVLLTTQQLAAMTPEEIDTTLESTLAFNDYDTNRILRTPFSCRARAAGLERTLYQCPRCHALYHMQTKGDTIVCLACQNGARMDEFGLLHPLNDNDVIFDDPVQWVAFEREMAHRLLLEGGMQQEAALFSPTDNARLERCGEGVLAITTDTLRFDGQKNGEPFHWSMSTARLSALPFSFKQTYWEVPDAREYYRMVPKQTGSLLHMALMLEAAHARRTDTPSVSGEGRRPS